MTPKITYAELKKFEINYHKGSYPHQRLGQAFVNTFTRGSEPCPDIFYESDNKKALSMIVQRYVLEE